MILLVLLTALYVASPANLAVYLNVPFLVSLIFTVATPLALVFAEYVLPLTLKVIFLFLMALPEDFSVAVSFLVAFFLKVFLIILNVVAFLVTVTVGVDAGAVVVCFDVSAVMLKVLWA